MSKTPGKKTIGTIVGLALVLTIPAASAFSAPSCPEVDSARAMLTRAAATQNDRELQAPRGQETQASRSQDIQAPRQGQDVQAPRNQDIQSPRSGTTASGSGQATVPSHMTRAAALVKEADTACQAGKTAEASQKAKAAIVLMQQ